jgi:hypothetical protein
VTVEFLSTPNSDAGLDFGFGPHGFCSFFTKVFYLFLAVLHKQSRGHDSRGRPEADGHSNALRHLCFLRALDISAAGRTI